MSNYNPNQYNPKAHWFHYNREIVSKFLLADAIRRGSLVLLPLPSQKYFDKEDAANQLLEGSKLNEKLKQIREKGKIVIGKHKGTEGYRVALRIFVNGLVICQRRLTGDYPVSVFD